MNWHADSYHIYGKDIETAKHLLFDRINSINFEDRTFNFHDDFIQEMYNDAEKVVTAKIDEYDSTH